MAVTLEKAAATFEKRHVEYFGAGGGPAFAIRGVDGAERVVGRGSPVATLIARQPDALEALSSLDRLRIAEAYLSGGLDVEGELRPLLAHRTFFSDSHPLQTAWHLFRPKIQGQQTADAEFISDHYDTESDFFLLFLDTRHRCYSQGVFESDNESLEDAITRKLDFALSSVGAKPGDRVLDVGAGWGAFTEYAGRRGIRVTSLTISRESEKHVNALIARENLPCSVRFEHLYDHTPEQPYDAIVNLGVTEHLPDYDRSLAHYGTMLKPGGRICLDASAKRKKYDVSSFLRRHVYPGNGSPMCLHDYLRAVAASPFEVLAVHNDRISYGLTAQHWAERLESAREEIEQRWGRAQYRKFRLYLWGCVDGFSRDDIQAYRVVLELPELPGRPGVNAGDGAALPAWRPQHAPGGDHRHE